MSCAVGGGQSLAMEGPALPKREAGPIGGTAADLRRLSMEQAFDLLKRLGMPPEDIERKPRTQTF